MFSGFERHAIELLPDGPAILEHIDVLVDGRYLAGQRLGSGLRGSANQRAHFLTDRYRQDDLDRTPVAEIHIAADGQIRQSGVNPIQLRGRKSGRPRT